MVEKSGVGSGGMPPFAGNPSQMPIPEQYYYYSQPQDAQYFRMQAPQFQMDPNVNPYLQFGNFPMQNYQYDPYSQYYNKKEAKQKQLDPEKQEKVNAKRIGKADYALNKYAHLSAINSSEYKVPENGKFFIIKSFEEGNVHKAIKYQVWSSTQNGNLILQSAFIQAKKSNIPVYLFFSVNASKQFVGMAEMTSEINMDKKMDYWQQKEKWLGIFNIKWIFIKDIPTFIFSKPEYSYLGNDGEQKTVVKSRDCQEVPINIGQLMFKDFQGFNNKTSILMAFEKYDNAENEKKNKEDEQMLCGNIQINIQSQKKGRKKKPKIGALQPVAKEEKALYPEKNQKEEKSQGDSNPNLLNEKPLQENSQLEKK